MSQSRASGWQTWAPVVLTSSCIILIPFGRSVELPVFIMAGVSLVLATRRRSDWIIDSGLKYFTLAFALIWLGAVFALPDAVNQPKSAGVVTGYLRFLLAGWFVVALLREPWGHRVVFHVAAWALWIWSADVLLQAMTGRDLLGYEASRNRLNGLFGPGAPKFGLVTALLLPLAVEHMRKAWSPVWTVLALATICAAIILAGRRATWIHLFVLACFYLVIAWRAKGQRILVPVLVIVLGSALLGAGLYTTSDRLQGRVKGVLSALSEGATGTDAVGHRVWIWRAAGNMIADHPLNGVGPRGFRYAFMDHAHPEDPFVHGRSTESKIAMHTHQLLLEIMAETGLIGMAGFLAFGLVLVWHFRRQNHAARQLMLPWGLCLAGGLFPLNTHLAFYSSFWSQLLWWLVAGFFAAGAMSCVADRR